MGKDIGAEVKTNIINRLALGFVDWEPPVCPSVQPLPRLASPVRPTFHPEPLPRAPGRSPPGTLPLVPPDSVPLVPLRPAARTGTYYAIKLGTTADHFGHVLLASTYLLQKPCLVWESSSFLLFGFSARRKDLRDQPVKIGKFGVDLDSDRYASAPASPTSNLDPSSSMDAPIPGNRAAQPELPDVHIPDSASDPESRVAAVEDSLANIGVLLLRVLHNSQNPPAAAPVPAAPAPAGGPDFTTLTPVAKSVL
ncbi:hypothetical protein K438DRAFT_1986713 [Mycena galopus ATCC 62051]|nr:hypothetical protein K438DRAFT_1986713 [Mycena galopus ATCC 62051]